MPEVSEFHERHGHISFDTLQSLPERPKVYTKPRCEACEKGKTKSPPKNHQKKAPKIRITRAPERLHSDLVGPIKPITPSSQLKYLLVTTDNFSRYVVAKPLKNLGTSDALIEIINSCESA
jgi:hypothetical protein